MGLLQLGGFARHGIMVKMASFGEGRASTMLYSFLFTDDFLLAELPLASRVHEHLIKNMDKYM